MWNRILSSIEMPKKVMLTSIALVICVALLGLILFIEVPLFSTVKDGADFLGSQSGKAVGALTGSLNAVEKYPDTAQEASTDATDADVTLEQIQNSFAEIATLEVMDADVKIDYVWKYGDKESYVELFQLDGKVVLTVNLQDANITNEDSTIYVNLRKPDLELRYEGEPKSIATYEPTIPNFNLAKKGKDAALGEFDTMLKSIEEVRTQIRSNEWIDYDLIMKEGEESATKTIEVFVKSFCQKDVIVQFEGEGEINAQF